MGASTRRQPLPPPSPRQIGVAAPGQDIANNPVAQALGGTRWSPADAANARAFQATQEARQRSEQEAARSRGELAKGTTRRPDPSGIELNPIFQPVMTSNLAPVTQPSPKGSRPGDGLLPPWAQPVQAPPQPAPSPKSSRIGQAQDRLSALSQRAPSPKSVQPRPSPKGSRY